jgi:hypothetical protein
MPAGSFSDTVRREVEFRFQATGQQALASTAAAMSALEQQILTLARVTPASTAAYAAHQKQLATLAAEYERLSTVARALGERLNGSLANPQTVARSQAAGRAILEVSRGLEDFAMAGVRGALNNIPQAVYAIGQSFGWSQTKVANLTASISILATAGYLVIENWRGFQNFFTDLFTNPTRALETLRDGINNAGSALSNAFSPTSANNARTRVEVLGSALKDAEDRVKALASLSRATDAEMAELTYGRARVEMLKKAYDEAREAAELMKSAGKETEDAAKSFEQGWEAEGGRVLGPMLRKALETMAGGPDGVLSNPRLGLKGKPAEFASGLVGLAADQSDPRNREAFASILSALDIGGFGGRAEVVRLGTFHPDHVKAQAEAEKRWERAKADATARQSKARDAVGPIQSEAMAGLLAGLAAGERSGQPEAARGAALDARIAGLLASSDLPADARPEAARQLREETLRRYRADRQGAGGLRGLMGEAAPSDVLAAFRKQGLDLATVKALAEAVAGGQGVEAATQAAESSAFRSMDAANVDPVAARNAAARFASEALAQYRARLGGRGGPAEAETARAVLAEVEAEQRSRRTALEREQVAADRASLRAQRAAELRTSEGVRRYDDAYGKQMAYAIARNEALQAQHAALAQANPAEARMFARTSGVVSDADLQSMIARAVAQGLLSAGATDAKGNRLTSEDASAVADQMTSEAFRDFGSKFQQYQQANGSALAATVAALRDAEAQLDAATADLNLFARQAQSARQRRAHGPRIRGN